MPRRLGYALPVRYRHGAARRLSPAVDHAQQAASAGGCRARCRPARSLADRRVPDLRLARARDVGLLRHHLRRSPGADQDRDAGRLEGSPAAEGLPARRHSGGVPRRDHPAARGPEVVRVSATAGGSGGSPPRADTAEGRVYNVGGQDWDESIAAVDEAADSGREERLIVNMGPRHPSTHGVLRLDLTLDGATGTE